MKRTPIRRRKALRSRSSLSSGQTRKRGGPIKKRGKKPSTFAYQYGSRARVAWIKSLPCTVRSLVCVGPIENAHTARRSGMGLKGPASSVVPLCQRHHAQLHNMGVTTFERYHGGITLEWEAQAIDKRWLASSGRADSTETP